MFSVSIFKCQIQFKNWHRSLIAYGSHAFQQLRDHFILVSYDLHEFGINVNGKTGAEESEIVSHVQRNHYIHPLCNKQGRKEDQSTCYLILLLALIPFVN